MKSLSMLVAVLGLLGVAGCSCNPPVCEAGSQGCACLEGSTCNTGLVCSSDLKCGAAVTIGVQVSDATARGCEFVLTEAAGTEVVSVNFKDGTRGSWIRQAPKVAVTVVSGGDSAISNAVSLGLSGSASGVAFSKVSCVDLKGQRLASTLSIR
jgi:hypothetical protein